MISLEFVANGSPGYNFVIPKETGYCYRKVVRCRAEKSYGASREPIEPSDGGTEQRFRNLMAASVVFFLMRCMKYLLIVRAWRR